MPMPGQSKPKVKTCARTFRIVELVDELNGATLTELSQQTDMAKSTVHNHLTTLEQLRLIVKEGECYYPGLKFLRYGMNAKRRNGLSSIAKPELENVAEETGEVAWLVVEEHGKGIYLEKAEGSKAVQTFGQTGREVYLHASSVGKAILAHLPDSRIERIIEHHGLPAMTEQTVTDQGELFDELDTIRERGVAFNRGETVPGVRGIACPIIYNGEVWGSVAIGAPAERLKGKTFSEVVPSILSGATNAIELTLRHEDSAA